MEVDHQPTADDGRPLGRVWLVRLTRGTRGVVIASELGRPSADHLAGQIAQSQPTDPDTGYVDMGTRLYDPSQGRFTTRDMLFGDLNQPMSLNQYVYGNDNPLSMVDPNGMDACRVIDGTYYVCPPSGNRQGSRGTVPTSPPFIGPLPLIAPIPLPVWHFARLLGKSLPRNVGSTGYEVAMWTIGMLGILGQEPPGSYAGADIPVFPGTLSITSARIGYRDAGPEGCDCYTLRGAVSVDDHTINHDSGYEVASASFGLKFSTGLSASVATHLSRNGDIVTQSFTTFVPKVNGLPTSAEFLVYDADPTAPANFPITQRLEFQF